MIRSDAGDTHRLSLSARVVSAVDRQVKAKPQGKKGLCHKRNRRNRDVEAHFGRAVGERVQQSTCVGTASSLVGPLIALV